MANCPSCNNGLPSIPIKNCPHCGALLTVDDSTQRPPTQRLDIDTAELTGGPSNQQVFTAESRLVIDLKGRKVSVNLPPDSYITFGRLDQFSAVRPSVDLGQEGFVNGVSRLHAIIHHREKKLYLIDLDSTNGTFINNHRLIPFEPRTLGDKDLLKFGLFSFRIRFES